MKKKNTIWIFLGVLVCLLAVYGIVVRINQSQEAKKEAKAESEKIYLTQIEDLSKISFTGTSELLAFTKTDENWTLDSDTEIPLSQDTMASLASSFSNLLATRQLEDADDLSSYGLDAPSNTITLTDADGKAYKILIGNSSSDGDYYATLDGSNAVYTIDAELMDSMAVEVSSLVENDTFPTIGSDNLVKVAVTQNGTTTEYTADNTDDEDSIAVITGGIGVVTFDTCVNYSVSDEELTQYGLDEATRAAVTITYTEDDQEKNVTLYVGGTDEDGSNRYIQLEGSKLVYTLSVEKINNLLNEPS